MKQAKVMRLQPGWWKEDREPVKALIIKNERRVRTSSDLPEFLTVKEAAERMRKSTDFVYDIIRSGMLECQPMGRRKYVTPQAIADYFEREKHKVVKKAAG